MSAGMNFHLVLQPAAQPGLCPPQIQSPEGPGAAGRGWEEVRRAAPGVSGSPLKAGQPHLSTLRRFGDPRIVIVHPPTPPRPHPPSPIAGSPSRLVTAARSPDAGTAATAACVTQTKEGKRKKKKVGTGVGEFPRRTVSWTPALQPSRTHLPRRR